SSAAAAGNACNSRPNSAVPAVDDPEYEELLLLSGATYCGDSNSYRYRASVRPISAFEMLSVEPRCPPPFLAASARPPHVELTVGSYKHWMSCTSVAMDEKQSSCVVDGSMQSHEIRRIIGNMAVY